MSKLDWRALIEEQLDMLSSEQEQLEYEGRCPRIDVTSELVSGWFDDAYHPREASFKEQFDSSELAALAQFSEFFDVRLSELPSSQGTIRSWLASPVWREVMEAAVTVRARLCK